MQIRPFKQPTNLNTACILLACLMSLLASARLSQAAPMLPNLRAMEPVGDFGNLAQGATRCPNVNCGATALVNSSSSRSDILECMEIA